MIKLPKISIITPSFNQGDFLEECIDSVLSQNYPNLEYIIMDGGSTDNSVEIIKKYEKYLTYWQSRPDGGQYEAINEGFKKTTGEIMAWLNSDDKYHHHAFYKVAYLFSTYKHIDWLTGRHTKWDRDGRLMWVLFEYLATFSREKYLKKDYNDPAIQQESTFWRRSLWKKAGGMIRADLNFAGDVELWMRFFRHVQLYTVDTLLGGYREHGNQKSILFLDKYSEEAEMVLDEEIAFFRQGKYTEVFPAPLPVYISHGEIKSYIDQVFESTKHQIYKLSDDSGLVIELLMQRVIELTYKPDPYLIKTLLHIMKKIGIYDFYLRHPKYFSLTFHWVRRFFLLFSHKNDKGNVST